MGPIITGASVELSRGNDILAVVSADFETGGGNLPSDYGARLSREILKVLNGQISTTFTGDKL